MILFATEKPIRILLENQLSVVIIYIDDNKILITEENTSDKRHFYIHFSAIYASITTFYSNNKASIDLKTNKLPIKMTGFAKKEAQQLTDIIKQKTQRKSDNEQCKAIKKFNRVLGLALSEDMLTYKEKNILIQKAAKLGLNGFQLNILMSKNTPALSLSQNKQ